MKLALLAAVLLAGAAKTHAETADEVIQKYIKAVGGQDNWKKVNTLKMTGTMTAQGAEVTVTTTKVNGKALRLDIAVMGMNGYQILTTKDGWTYMPFAGQTKPEALTDDQVKQSQDQLDVRSELFTYKEKGDKVELLANDKVDGNDCYKVKLTDKDGNEETIYFDAKTYYEVKATIKAKGQDQEVATTFADYQKQDGGIVVPMKSGTVQGDITFKTIEVNKPVDDSIFKPTT